MLIEFLDALLISHLFHPRAWHQPGWRPKLQVGSVPDGLVTHMDSDA